MLNSSLRVILTGMLLVVVTAGTAQAFPGSAVNTGNSCKTCHGDVVDGKMEVTDEDLLLDLGTQLDGKTRGALKTFLATPGSSVDLAVNVLDGTVDYSLQLKRLEKGGQLNDAANVLDWTEDGDWDRQVNADPGDYFTLGPIRDGSDGVSIFTLGIAEGTPADVYDLEFAIAGQGGWYQDEHFYLQVNPVPEPGMLAMMLTVVGGAALVVVRRRRKD